MGESEIAPLIATHNRDTYLKSKNLPVPAGIMQEGSVLYSASKARARTPQNPRPDLDLRAPDSENGEPKTPTKVTDHVATRRAFSWINYFSGASFEILFFFTMSGPRFASLCWGPPGGFHP